MKDAKYRVIEIKGKKATYLYEDFSYWDKERRYSTHKRRCIGKLGEDGKPIYNKAYLSRQGNTGGASSDEATPAVSRKTSVSSTTLVGQELVFGLAEKRSGVGEVLRETLGDADAGAVLALARYALSRGKALSRAEDWLESHGMGGLGLTSQRVSDLLASLTHDRANAFFKAWVSRCPKDDTCLFDITSISTYGKGNMLAEWGYNRDGESLEQINLALLTSVASGLPLWYETLAGSMSDRTVLRQVLEKLAKMEMPRFTFYGDRGFYSQANLEFLKKAHVHYVIPVPSSVGWQKELIAEHRESLVSPRHLIDCGDGQVVYGKTVARKDRLGRHYCHIYFDPARKDKMVADFMKRLQMRKAELETGDTLEKHKDVYERYFVVKETKKGRTVTYNDKAVSDYVNSDSCFWVLRSDRLRNAEQALASYRGRNDVEMNFDDMKNTTDLNRLRNHNDRTVAGKIFVMFIALILKCQLRKDIGKIPPKERKYWSEQEFLDKVDSYSVVHFSGRYKDVFSTPTAAQRLIFDLLGIQYTFQGKKYNVNGKPKYS